MHDRGKISYSHLKSYKKGKLLLRSRQAAGFPSPMAFRRTLSHRFLDLVIANPSSSQFRSSDGATGRVPSLVRRILQRRPIVQPTEPPPVCLSLPVGDKLDSMIRGINSDRIRLDLVHPPPLAAYSGGMTMEEVKKVLRASQIEAVRSRLSTVPQSSISYSEFLHICRKESSAEETAVAVAHLLDESGAVIVLGDLVFLRPSEVVRAIGRVIPLPLTNQKGQGMKELREMEAKKAEIDRKAEAGVQRELWCGLGFLVAQTLGFMRLTFWELSWDVMEPVCFYVTSVYFLAGYTFFLRTSKEPSFEGIFRSRFAAKQKRIMRGCNFDLIKFNELKQQAGFDPGNAPSNKLVSAGFCSCSRSSLNGFV